MGTGHPFEMQTQDLSATKPGDTSALAERLERRNRELGILNSISEALNRSADVHAALRSTLALVAELLGLRSGWVWLLDSEHRPYLAASRHLPPFLQEPERMEGRLCLCLDAFMRGDTEKALRATGATGLHTESG